MIILSDHPTMRLIQPHWEVWGVWEEYRLPQECGVRVPLTLRLVFTHRLLFFFILTVKQKLSNKSSQLSFNIKNISVYVKFMVCSTKNTQMYKFILNAFDKRNNVICQLIL